METMKHKAELMQEIKNTKNDADIHRILSNHHTIAKLASKNIGLMYDSNKHRYYGVNDIDGVTITVPYDLYCLKSDLSNLVRYY